MFLPCYLCFNDTKIKIPFKVFIKEPAEELNETKMARTTR